MLIQLCRVGVEDFLQGDLVLPRSILVAVPVKFAFDQPLGSVGLGLMIGLHIRPTYRLSQLGHLQTFEPDNLQTPGSVVSAPLQALGDSVAIVYLDGSSDAEEYGFFLGRGKPD